MRHTILIILVLFVLHTVCFAQNCMETFIGSVEQALNDSGNKFNRMAKKAIKSSKNNQLLNNNFTIINIPIVESKERKNIETDKKEFFCHLRDIRLDYQHAIVANDSIIVGFIEECGTSNCNFSFFIAIDSIIERNGSKKLAMEVLRLEPDFIFTIFPMNNAYWYVKNGELKVLSYQHNNGVTERIKIYEPNDYIQTIDDITLEEFFYFKRMRKKVIAY